MSFTSWCGEPCSLCLDSPDPAWHVQRATHSGLCARHFLGATAAQRRDALMEEAMTCDDEPGVPPITTASIALELLLALPDAPEPDERRAA